MSAQASDVANRVSPISLRVYVIVSRHLPFLLRSDDSTTRHRIVRQMIQKLRHGVDALLALRATWNNYPPTRRRIVHKAVKIVVHYFVLDRAEQFGFEHLSSRDGGNGRAG